jgi:hypothetical protein
MQDIGHFFGLFMGLFIVFFLNGDRFDGGLGSPHLPRVFVISSFYLLHVNRELMRIRMVCCSFQRKGVCELSKFATESEIFLLFLVLEELLSLLLIVERFCMRSFALLDVGWFKFHFPHFRGNLLEYDSFPEVLL